MPGNSDGGMRKQKNFFLLFSHELSESQKADARSTWGIGRFLSPPHEIQALWSQIPADLAEIRPCLIPVMDWLSGLARPGDLVLIQGDFGATHLMVGHALTLGLIPVYATTVREATEEKQPDGSIRMEHRFRFRRFRVYGR